MPDVVSDSAFPDQVGVVGGPMIPCKVVEITATTAPTTTEGPRTEDGLKQLEQVQQYRIRYEVPHGAPHPSPAPERIEASWMTGAGEVRIAAIDLIADPRPDRTAGQRLDEAIRAKLDGWLDDICGRWRNGCPVDDHAAAIRMRAALLAVLERRGRAAPIRRSRGRAMADADPLTRWIQDVYGIPDDVWAAMMALNEAEARVREDDRQRMLAHMRDVAASMPQRLRAQGYDVPDGLQFEWR